MMFFHPTANAPQNLSYNPASSMPMFGSMPGGGMMSMLMQLQQQLISTMTVALGSLFQSGFAGSNLAGGGMPMMANFGLPGGGGQTQAGLGTFLGAVGQSSGHRGGQAKPPRQSSSAPRGDSGDSGDSKFTTLNVNIKSRPAMPQNKVLADVRKASQNADLIGWNEISLDRYRDAIKSLGPDWGHFMPKDGKYQISNPISYRKDEWKLLKGGFQKTHEGDHGICPDRYITWAKLKHKGSGEKIVRINTHTVAGAFSKTTSHNAWRRSSWNTHMNKLSAMVGKFEKQGYKVIIAGDMNRDSTKVLGNQVAYDNDLNKSTTDTGSTLDYLMHTRDPGLQSLNAGVLGGFNSDHHAVRGTYNLGRR